MAHQALIRKLRPNTRRKTWTPVAEATTDALTDREMELLMMGLVRPVKVETRDNGDGTFTHSLTYPPQPLANPKPG